MEPVSANRAARLTRGMHPKPWGRVAILIGILYVVAGYGSAALDPSIPEYARFAWRLTAWAVCAAVFAAHIGYEHSRQSVSPRTIAWHAAAAVAFGAFLLAAAAKAHAAMTATSAVPFWRYIVALAAWPAITALPAFVVALLISLVVARLTRKA